MSTASKGISKKLQSLEDLWLSESKSHLQGGRQGPEWGGERGVYRDLQSHLDGEGDGSESRSRCDQMWVGLAVHDILSNIILCRFYSCTQNLFQPLQGQWETEPGWGQRV